MRYFFKGFLGVLLGFCVLSALSLTACTGGGGAAITYEISVKYDESTATLSGTVALDFYNDTENEIADLKFNLYGNAFREGATYRPVSETYALRAYYAGESYGSMTVSNVENCAGWTVGGEDVNILTVNLSEPVYPEQRVNITISYSLALAKVNHRTGTTERCVNLGNFYPVLCAYTKEGFLECPYYYCGDPFVSSSANYSVKIELPPEYTVATSGKLISESNLSGAKTCEYSLENARDFAMVLSKEFEVLSGTVGGVEVYYYYTVDTNPEAGLKAACDSLQYFSDTYGEYSYPTLSVVQTGFCYGGMEYPALTMIAEGLDEGANAYTIVHENAHQWWYAMVGSNQLTDGWQDEGLAEYSTLCFFESHPDYGITRAGLINAAKAEYRAFFTVFEQLNGEVDTSMSRNLSTYSGELEYENITYNKGVLLFDTLRTAIGDDKFSAALKNYFRKNQGKIASVEDLYAVFLEQGVDVEGFFDAFIQGKIII